MPEWKLSKYQLEKLKKIGFYEVKSQENDGTIHIAVGKSKFTISPAGIVLEEGESVKPKSDKPKYHLQKPQHDLMKKFGYPEIVHQLANDDLVVKKDGEEWVFGYDGISLSKKEYDEKYGKYTSYSGGKGTTTPTTYTYSSKTVCQTNPEKCKPRPIEHVAWDADHTMWLLKNGIASSVTGPLKKLDDDTVIELSGGSKPGKKKKSKWKEPAPYVYKDLWSQMADDLDVGEEEMEELDEISDSLVEGLSPKDKDFLASLSGVTGEEQKLLALPPGPPPEKKETFEPHEINRITLLPTFRETLDRLEKQGIKSSVISLNTPGSVKRILEAFGLADRFVDIKDTWGNKGTVFSEITHKYGFCPCSSIFVDDTLGNVKDVADKCGLGLVIGKDKDVEKPLDIFNFIKEC